MKSALIVEDDPDIRRALLCTLGRSGWEVDAVAGVEAGLTFLRHQPRCVVLLDRQLEDGSGTQLLTAIRMHPSWNTVPVVVMSGNATPEEIARVFACGATDFLPKPFSLAAVMEKMELWASAEIAQQGIKRAG